MKKIFTYIALLAMFTAASCTDLLDKEPYQNYEKDYILTTVEGLDALLTGSYTIVKDRYYYGSLIYQYEAARGLDFFIRKSGGGTSMQREAQYSLSSTSNGAAPNAWQTIYSLITNLNRIIDHIDNVTGDINEIRRIKGEALTLRGLAYFDLMRLFAYPPHYSFDGHDGQKAFAKEEDWVKASRGVPIIWDSEMSLNIEKYEVRREDAEDTYFYILEQLYMGKELLKGKTEIRGHVNAAPATALLMRVLLYMEEWDSVVTVGEEWLANYEARYSMIPYDSYPTSYYKTFNSESIWELSYTTSTDLGRNSLNYWARKPTYDDPESPDYGEVSSDIGYSRMGMQWGHTNRGLDFLTYYPDDIRQVFICELGLQEKPGWKGFRKYVGDPYHYTHNIPIVRLPEVYLTMAEAYIKSTTYANPGLAGEYASRVSSVRRLADISGSNINDVYNERRREFMFEGHNYWDMFRTGRGIQSRQADLDGAYADDASISFGTIGNSAHYRAVYPIPQREMNSNPAIRDQQNPGYAKYVSGGEEEI